MVINDLLDAVEMDWRMQERKGLASARSHMRPIREALGPEAAEAVDTSRLRAYVLARRQAGKAAATINRELAVLSRAFTLARGDGKLLRTPVFPRLREQNVRQGTYTAEEVQRIVQELPEHYRPVVQFGYLSGRRRGEILALQWGDVDLAQRCINVRGATTKNGQADVIPLTGELLTLVLDLWERRRDTCPWVFHWRGQPISAGFSETFARAARRAGLYGRLFHDLRRTVSTDLEQAGVPQSVGMRITGHKTASTYQRYNIVRQRPIVEAMERLSGFRAGEREEQRRIAEQE